MIRILDMSGLKLFGDTDNPDGAFVITKREQQNKLSMLILNPVRYFSSDGV
jgi:hypothetical protein